MKIFNCTINYEMQYIVLFICFSCLFLPHHILPISFFYISGFLFFCFSYKISVSYTDYLILLVFFFITAISLEVNVFMNTILYCITFLLFTNNKIKYNHFDITKPIKLILFLILLSISMQLVLSYLNGGIIDDKGQSRLSLTIGDPNFSGLLILFFIFLIFSINLKFLSIVIFAISVFLLESRALLISGIIFFIIELFSTKKYISVRLFFAFQILIFILFIIFISNWKIILMSIEIFKEYYIGNSDLRLLDFYDQSNIGRFTGFEIFINLIFSDIKFLFYGLGNENNFQIYNSVLPHNSLIYLVSTNGFFYSALVMFLFYRMLKLSVGNNTRLSISMSFIFYTTFLHGGYSYIFISLYIISALMFNRKVYNENII